VFLEQSLNGSNEAFVSTGERFSLIVEFDLVLKTHWTGIDAGVDFVNSNAGWSAIVGGPKERVCTTIPGQVTDMKIQSGPFRSCQNVGS